MSYKISPQTTRAGIPTASDDSTKGFNIGSMWVDTSTTPDSLYICTSNAAGAATWISAGGITVHSSLSVLQWGSAGHSGTTNSVACFDETTGAAKTVQATVDGTVLGFSGGVLQFIAVTAAVAIVDPRSLDVEYLWNNANVIAPTADAQVVTGSIA